MEASHWTRSHLTRRGFLHGMGRAAGALALAPAAAACRGSAKQSGGAANGESALRPVKGGTLISSINVDISNLDYAFSVDLYSNAIIPNCVEPLLTVDTQGQPAGLLATSWQQPDDHTYIFKLRQGVKFQDGTDFTADAVEYSLNRIRTNKASTSYQGLVYIDKVEKPDQGTVKLTLSGPFAPLLYNLAANAGRVISPPIGEKYGKDRLKLDLTNQGTGPFRFADWKKDDHVTLVRNESYWGRDAAGIQLPYVDKLIYRVIPDPSQSLASLRNGELDVLSLGMGLGVVPPKDVAGVKADPSLSYRDRPGNSFTYLYFNEAREPFGNREVRQAICYAIDRSAITHSLLFDTASPADVIFTPAIWTHDPDYHPYLKRDVAKARQLLAQAGKPNGFAFTLLISNAPAVQQIAELIKDQLKEAGVEMAIQILDVPKLLESLSRGEHQVGQVGAVGGLDPSSWVYPYFRTGGVSNSWTHYSNSEADRLLEQGRTTLDPATRKPLYQQAQRLIMADAAVCPLYNPALAALSSKKVHNVPLGPTPAVGASQVWKTA